MFLPFFLLVLIVSDWEIPWCGSGHRAVLPAERGDAGAAPHGLVRGLGPCEAPAEHQARPWARREVDCEVSQEAHLGKCFAFISIFIRR